MGFVLLAAVLTLAPAAGQPPLNAPALPMSEVEACPIEYGNPMARYGRWAGQVALYDAEADNAGNLVRLERRIIEGREHMPKLVRLEPFEDCVRKWKFAGAGAFTIRLLGNGGGPWTIDVMQDSRMFRLRVPVADR